MEIKNLSGRIQELKRLRNLIELEYDGLMEAGKEAGKEADNQFRAGLEFSCPADVEGLNDGANSIKYGLKQFNEGISFLEAAYRRSVRFRKEETIKETKGDPQ